MSVQRCGDRGRGVRAAPAADGRARPRRPRSVRPPAISNRTSAAWQGALRSC